MNSTRGTFEDYYGHLFSDKPLRRPKRETMHFVATIIKASDLFKFAKEQGIAKDIRDLIEYDQIDNDHFMWNRSCFSVRYDTILDLDWAPSVKEMVRRYMAIHDIEVLVIVTGRDAHLLIGENR